MGWDDPADKALSPTSDLFFPEPKLETMSPPLNSLSPGNPIEDAAVFGGGEPVGEEPLFQTPRPMTDSRENLYSTPLSWPRPYTSSRLATYTGNVLPSQEELEKLRSIAMPTPTCTNEPHSPSSERSSSPDNRRKRKSSIEEDDDDEDSSPPTSGRHPPVKKTAHNMIEKRYRTNLNDKIAALRDSVPALRVVTRKGGMEGEDLQGLTPAHKLNKATVLSKATEYIAHLEKRNKTLTKENATLKSRVDAFEILIRARQTGNTAVQNQNQRPVSR
jgi:hypothetical protein